MFERYTDRARRSIVLAQEHARMLRHAVIDVDHVLLGLAAEGEGVAFRALDKAGASAEGIRDAIAKSWPPSIAASAGHIPFTLESKKALELALRESIALGHNYIGTEHLLLGLVADCLARTESPVAVVLRACATAPGEVREAVMTLLHGYGEAPAVPGPQDAEAVDCRAELLGRLDDIGRQVQAMRRQLGAE